MNSDHIIRLTRHDPYRNILADRLVAMRQLDRVDVSFAAFLVLLVILRRDAELLRSVRADQRDVVPGNFGERLGQLLQPAVVREAAVIDGWIRAKDEFV